MSSEITRDVFCCFEAAIKKYHSPVVVLFLLEPLTVEQLEFPFDNSCQCLKSTKIEYILTEVFHQCGVIFARGKFNLTNNNST